MGSGQNIIFARVDFQDSGAWAMTTPPTFTNLDFPWFPPNLRGFSPPKKAKKGPWFFSTSKISSNAVQRWSALAIKEWCKVSMRSALAGCNKGDLPNLGVSLNGADPF